MWTNICAKTIVDTSLWKAWERAMLFVGNYGTKITFGDGLEKKKAWDSQVDIVLDEHAVSEAIFGHCHPSDPFCTPDKIKAYRDEYTEKFDASKFDYTYYDILKNGFEKYIPCKHDMGVYTCSNIDQINILAEGLQKQIDEQVQSNRNVAVLFNPCVDNFSGKSIPCLNEVLVRWEGGNKCSVHTLFRSHDLASAWNANMVALSYFLNKEVAKSCCCKIDFWNEKNFSLHIYDYDMPILEKIKIVPRNPALEHLQDRFDFMNVSLFK